MTTLKLPIEGVELGADLCLSGDETGIVVFVHGSGSSRHSPRNQQVARYFNEHVLATLLFDLLTEDEHREDVITRAWRFDIALLARRLEGVIDWLGSNPASAAQRIGLFGASTGAAAALIAAARRPDAVQAVVSRGGRTDLAGDALDQVRVPTMQIVGSEDDVVLRLNREVSDRLRCEQALTVVSGATHLFDEPGTLELAADAARDWFERYLNPRA
ncbi:dienelactone hydrolase family protein [Stutzerimonas nitrititolerans]|uniref:dienelactone hydrolase family protein n=1 Tax=Stutzerimonas nitrititolerans TaxID=2482751 RepID=UPI00289C9ABD|nr:dienelactone hydrolase family protein [Stutzerimonas nitrititolerans]